MIAAYESDRLEQGYYRQTGTVLQRRDSSKEGQSLLLFMRDLGPRWVNAPAASGKNRFGGATEPLVWGEFNLYQSPKSLYLQAAEVKEDFIALRDSPLKLTTALKFYKRLSRVLMTGHESNQILTLLWGTLILLKENCPVDSVEFRFTWRLLKGTGLAPSMQSCVNCGAKLCGAAFWNGDGLLCEACGSGLGKTALLRETLKMMQLAALLDHDKFMEWSRLNESPEIFKEQTKKLITLFSDFS